MKDELNIEDKIAFVVLSYDGFYDLWQPFFDYFFKCWPDCKYKIYLLNNVKEFIHNRVNNLSVGEDLGWSNSLKKGLNKIDEKYVFFFYEDTMITDINFLKLQSGFHFALNNNITSISFRPSPFLFGRKKVNDNSEYFIISENALYRNSLFLNLIKRETLLELLDEKENAWQFEKNGNIRSKKYIFLSSKSNPVKYIHCIVKGKWFNKPYKKISKNYKFEKLNHLLSRKEELILKIKEDILKFYYNILPIKIIVKIENIRNKNY